MEMDHDYGDEDASPVRTTSKTYGGGQRTKVAGREIMGKVVKLGNMQWFQNERLLKLEKTSLSYYKKAPGDFSDELMFSKEIQDKKMKPKYSIPLAKISKVGQLDAEEKQKFKKQFTEEYGVFKIEFDKNSKVQGYLKDDQNVEDASYQPDPKNIETWYFSTGKLPTEDQKQEHKGKLERPANLQDWLVNLALLTKEQNHQVQIEPSVKNAIAAAEEEFSHLYCQEGDKKQENIFVPNMIEEKRKSTQENIKPNQQSKTKVLGDGKKPNMQMVIDQVVSIQPTSNNQGIQPKQNLNNQGYGSSQMQEKRGILFDKISKYEKDHEKIDGEYSKKEHQGWDLKFQNYWGLIVKSNAAKDTKANTKISEHFLSHVSNFKQKAEELVMEIVNELHLPNQRYKDRLKDKDKREGFECFMETEVNSDDGLQRIYTIDDQKILVKLTHQGATYSDDLNEMYKKDGDTTDHNVTSTTAQHQLQKLERYWWKRYGREFLSYDVMFDALFLASKQQDQFALRTPLVTMVDYKGFRAICTAMFTIGSDLQPDFGFYNGQFKCPEEELLQKVMKIGDILNLKENKIMKKGFSSQQLEIIPLSSQLKIYRHQQQEEGDKKEYSPTMHNWFQFHYTDLEYSGEPLYCLKSQDIFPYDWEVQDKIHNTNKVLRPEFVCQYERPLKSDTKKPIPNNQNINLTEKLKNSLKGVERKNNKDQDDDDQINTMELSEASKMLRRSQVNQLVDLLDSLIIVPVDSNSLEQVFHIQGVNMRYLGQVAFICASPHIKDICLTEMLARTLKRIFNTQISQNIIDNQSNLQQVQAELQAITKSIETDTYEQQVNLGDPRNKKQNQQLNYEQLIEQKNQLEAEMNELSQDMDKLTKIWIQDFMNLIFGHGKEKDHFWKTILLPEVAQYYQVVIPEISSYYQDYPLEELEKFYEQNEVKYNALYFAVLDQIGLVCKTNSLEDNFSKQKTRKQDQKKDSFENMPQEEQFYKSFNRTEQPFGEFGVGKGITKVYEKKYEFEFVPKSRTFQFRNLPYTLEANRFQEYKNNDKIEQAIECCRMRLCLKKWLCGDDIAQQTVNADLATLSLEKEKYSEAHQYAWKALQKIHSLRAASIKFYCLIIQANYLGGEIQIADSTFTKALSTLDHHWGPFHPLHVNIYSIMAQLLIQKGRSKYDDAKYLYQSSLLCCMRLLGPNHIQTGEVHMDFGKLYLKKEEKRESLQHFTEAYLIYKSYFGTTALQTAEAAVNIANLLEEQKRTEEAQKYIIDAAQTYQNVYTEQNPNTLKVLWQLVTIFYENKNPKTEEQAQFLLTLLQKRDQLNEPFNQEVETIKIQVIATLIMEITRNKAIYEKRLIKAFLDKLLFNRKLLEAKEKHEEIIPSLKEYHYSEIDAQRITSVKYLKDMIPVKGQQKLQEWYQNPGFKEQYHQYLNDIVAKESQIQKQKEQKREQQQNFQEKSKSSQEGQEEQQQEHQKIFTDDTENFEQSEFFMKLIQTFEKINFYNLIM